MAIDLNNYSKTIDGVKYVPFDKAVEALNELARLYSTEKLDEALNEITKASQIMSKIENQEVKDD
tara:strand:- start:81 stop:275 length:195 start_codon:yes stop_codon:yes gene_type:complete